MSKAYSRLWMLRNLKKHGASRTDLVDVYTKQCRSILELAVPVWNSSITVSEINQIERVQKTACAIILGKYDENYENALETLKLKSLEDRRVAICVNFAKKAQQHDKFKNWFVETEEPSLTKFKPVPYRTKRYMKSPIPYFNEAN